MRPTWIFLAALAAANIAVADDAGPDIVVEPILRAETGRGIVIEAEITDKDGVFDPKLSYRAIGETKFLTSAMVPAGGSNRFRAEIPGSAVTGPMEYFVEAYDAQGNGPSRSAPATRPHKVFVSAPEQREERKKKEKATARAPDILHQVVQRAPQGRSIPIEASFRGPSGVFNPVVSFRRVGSANFTQLSMAELPASAASSRVDEGIIVGTGGTGRFVAEVPGAFTNGDIEYYIEALDEQGNGPTKHGERERPHVVRTFEAPANAPTVVTAVAPSPMTLPDEGFTMPPPPVPEGVDPDVAIVSCLEVPRENETPDNEKLYPCRRVAENVPAAALSRFKLGELKMRYENYPDAVDAFADATKEAPTWPAAWFRLAQALQSKRDWAKTREAYLEYLKLVPKPIEFDALVKRMATVDYELDLEKRDQKEAEAKAVREKEAAAKKSKEREQQRLEEERRRKREMLVSAPGHWGFAAYDFESFNDREEVFYGLQLRLRFKHPAAPFLFFGAAATAGVARTVDENATLLTIAPIIGLNLLALPAPSAAKYSLLSPFISYEPRIVINGEWLTTSDSVHHIVSVGNHFEFGSFGIDVAYGIPLTGTHDGAFTLALGAKLGDGK